jgi:hypothetical protein
MSESARRLARELCGIWFKTVDAIIVRMTKPRRLPPAAQDHAVRKRRWDLTPVRRFCMDCLRGGPQLRHRFSGPGAPCGIGTVSMHWFVARIGSFGNGV